MPGSSVDNLSTARLIAVMIRAPVALAFAVLLAIPAPAMVGNAPPAGELGRSVVLIVGSRGTSCSGAALARDLILTAGHCVMPGADYKIAEFDAARQATLRDATTISQHPEFDVNAVLRHRVTADVALIKMAAPLNVTPLPLSISSARVAPGDRFTVAGVGLGVPGDGKTGGIARRAELIVTGQPGTLQIRLFDPVTKNQRAGLGACTGDSGAPALILQDGHLAIAGVVSWSTGPNSGDGCGGLTGVTPLVRYRDWVVSAARKLGSPLAP